MTCQPIHPPERPDVLSDEETPSMVSDEDLEVPNETEDDKTARLRRNKAKLARKNHAEHHKEALMRYHSTLRDYEWELNWRNLEDGAECNHIAEQRQKENADQNRHQAREGVSRNLDLDFIRVVGQNVYTTPLANVMAVEDVLAAKANPTLDDERLKVLL